MNLEATFGTRRPIVGMVHLPPLPGSPGAGDAEIGSVVEGALADARALEAGGVDGLLVENFGDAPFYPDDVPKHTVAAMTRVASAVVREVDLPVGINVLRNDAAAALAVATAVGGAFVRVNVHTGARVTDQGIIEGRAHETLRLRERLAPGDGDDADGDADSREAGGRVAIWADVDVKHSARLGEGSLRQDVSEAVERGLADAVVVSGPATGAEVEATALRGVLDALEALDRSVPVIVGSGVSSDDVADLLADADGVIVGTALKEGGETTAPVSETRVASLVDRADEVR